MQQKCALFDFDGVIANTEPLYDYFWNDAAKRYGLKISNFASLIKGTVMKDLQQKYFSYLSEEDKERMCRECSEYELHMNLWGFTPDYFTYSDEYFKEFLKANSGNLKAEFFIPLLVNKLITEGTARVKVLDTTAKWFGVTYAADRPGVVAKFKSLHDSGVYPAKLF